MASKRFICFLGYTNHVGGDATVRFETQSGKYNYHTSKQVAETTDWLSKKSNAKALNYVKKNCYRWEKEDEGQKEEGTQAFTKVPKGTEIKGDLQ